MISDSKGVYFACSEASCPRSPQFSQLEQKEQLSSLTLAVFREEKEFYPNCGLACRCIVKYDKFEGTLLNIPLKVPFDNLYIQINGKAIKPEKSFLFDGVKNNLLNFISEGRSFERFKCMDFINLMFNSPLTPGVFYIDEFTALQPYDSQTLLPGAILEMYQEGGLIFQKDKIEIRQNSAIHFALYLGKKCFISLYGPEGPLRVATLEDMKTAYGDHPLLLWYPKKDISQVMDLINKKIEKARNKSLT